EAAARALLDPPGSTQTLELAGPSEYSFDEAAQAYSRGMGKPVNAVQVPEAGILPALQQAGFSTAMAELFREMAAGMARGHVSFEGGSAKPVRGKVTFDAFVKELLSG